MSGFDRGEQWFFIATRSIVPSPRLSINFARPKSRIFAWPSRVIMMLSGLRSR